MEHGESHGECWIEHRHLTQSGLHICIYSDGDVTLDDGDMHMQLSQDGAIELLAFLHLHNERTKGNKR